MCFVFVMTKMILVAAPANDRSTPEQTFGARSFLTLGMVGPQQRLGISLKEMRVLPNLGNGRSPTEAGNFLEGNESPS